MKHKGLIASVLIVALLCVCLASLFATWQGVKMAQGTGIRFNPLNWSVDQVTASAKAEKKLKVSGPVSLSVVTYMGNITVQAGQPGQITVKTETSTWGNSEADAQAALKDITVVVDQSGDTVKISVDQAVVVDTLHIGPRGGRVDFTVTVPPDTAVTLNSSEGALTLTGTSGAANLETSSGNLSLTDVTGKITAHTENGEISAKNIGAGESIKLTSEFGAISLDTAKGADVTISSSNGNLEQLINIQASRALSIVGEFGDVQLHDSRAKTLEITSNNGAIDLSNVDVAGKLTVKSDFGNLTLEKVTALGYDLKSQNGKISLDGAQNTVKAHSDFGSVEVLNAQNATLDLSSNNGAITFAGSLGSGPHSIKSDFGNIEVTLPPESAITLDLQTDFGKIKSNFSITVSGTMDSNNWNGSINGGGAKLTVKTENGNINLQSAKQEEKK